MSDCLEIFNVSDTEIMSEEEIRINFEKYKNGDLKARNKIIKSNIGLVISIAKEYYIKGYEIEELLSIGSIGLIKAIDTYDITDENTFLAYAKNCINNEILINIKRKKIKCDNVCKSLKDKLDETSVDNFLCIMDSLSKEQMDVMSMYYELDNYVCNSTEKLESFNTNQLTFLKLISNVLRKAKNKIIKSDSLEDFVKKID